MFFGKPLIHTQEESTWAKGEIRSKVSQGEACRRGARSSRCVSLVWEEPVSAQTAKKQPVCLVEVFGTDLTCSQVLSGLFAVLKLREGE